MTEKKAQRPIVVKQKKIESRPHGSAWKIAYADFVTAMMAFFLLMWLMGTIDGQAKGGVAEYFKRPLKMIFTGKSSLGESALILQGGGRDLTVVNAEAKDKTKAQPQETMNLKNAENLMQKEELSKMMLIKKQMDKLVESDSKIAPYKNQITTDITSEGLRVQILDEQNRPMFALSRAEIEPWTREIIKELAPTLNQMPNKVSISGHTDAKPFANGSKSYSNWELSANRALEARRVLVDGGIEEARILRVIGLASSVLLLPQEPMNPINRRITIILLSKKAEEAAILEGAKPSMDLETIKASLNEAPRELTPAIPAVQ